MLLPVDIGITVSFLLAFALSDSVEVTDVVAAILVARLCIWLLVEAHWTVFVNCLHAELIDFKEIHPGGEPKSFTMKCK